MLKGAWGLCGLIVRRDWLRMLVWIVVLGGFAIAIPLVFQGLFGSDAERQAMAETMKNPAMTALLGIGYGLDDYQTGQMMANEMLMMLMISVAIANITMVVRHTRKVEELGRLEMILSLPVGRMANLSATLLMALIFDAVIVIEHVAIFTLLGIDSMPLAGNVVFALCLGLAGLFFAAATALIVQIANTSRFATGISMAFFAVCYMLRAYGDIGNETLSLISPLGLLERTKVYVDNDVWPLLVVFGLAVLLCIPAYLLQNRRDMGAGLLPQRSGRARAHAALLSPIGLAWRLNRGMFFGWAIGMLLLGAMYGSVFGDLEGFIDSSDYIKAILANSSYSYTEQFMAMLLTFLPVFGTVPALYMALKAYSEEKHGKIDNLVSRSVSRASVLTSYVVISMVACAVMAFLAVFGLWLAAYMTMAEPISFGLMMEAGMSYVPAMLVICGLAFALVGFAPKFASAIWVYLGYVFFAGYLARVMQLDESVGVLSPFHYIAQVPVETFEAAPIVALSALAIALTAVGYLGYRRRDLAG